MRHAIRSANSEYAVRALVIIAIFSATPASAQRVVAPTARSHYLAVPVPFEQAEIATQQAKKAHPRTVISTAVTAPPEIVQLTRALKNNPDLIYQYVHDNIEFSPLWGYLKGPVGTLLDGRGDSFDQSALMVALLNQASLVNPAITNVNFQYGQLNLTNAQIQSWLGADSSSIAGVMASGGIPGTVVAGGAHIGHVWVSVSINGTAYVFDPAFKSHTWNTGIVSNLAGIIGYTQAQFVADAGATVTATTVQNINRSALRDDLTGYAGKLAGYLRTNMPNAAVSDVVGGSTIVPAPFSNLQTVRQTTNPNQLAAPTTWASIPGQYYATYTVTLPDTDGVTFNSVDIYGHRLSIFFDSSFTPNLTWDGYPVTSGYPVNEWDSVAIEETVEIPWLPLANQDFQQYITAETNQGGLMVGYIVATGWDQVGRGMIEKHRRILSQAINSGAAPNSELVLGETLSVLGYTWLAECAAQQHLSDQLLGTVTEYLYGGGIVGQAPGTDMTSPYVDLPLNFANMPARVNGAAQQTPNSQAAFLDSSGTSSSFESAALEQTQANVPGFAAASTVKLLDMAVQINDPIFDINNGTAGSTAQTYYNTIRPQLVPTYAPQVLSALDSYVTQGNRVIAPLHGNTAIGQWTGTGFKTMYSGAGTFTYGEIISGGLAGRQRGMAGGFGGMDDPQSFWNTLLSMLPPGWLGNSGSGDGTGNVGDPVDHRNGSLQYKNVDLTIGPTPFPYGLSLERSYDSNAQGMTGPLGNGWTHSLAVTAMVGSDGFTGMNDGTALNAVSSIVSLYVSSDLIKGQAVYGHANAQYFILEAAVNRWFTDHLTQNVVNVAQGWTSVEFQKMADGSYSPPVGSVHILDAPGGKFRYRTKAGVTMNFNASGQITSWANPAGASVSFTYSNGLLSTVANAATGRQLTLNYSGNLISSVSDGFRTVSYGYTSKNLTSFTDAAGQKTTYAYDTSGAQDTLGHLTQVFNPSNPTTAFVTNYYDGLGKVGLQADANGNVTQMFFAGERSEVDDPLGSHHVWYNDPRGNVTMEIQDYGPAPRLNVTTLNTYDNQGNLLTMTKPEGNSVVYTWDALSNPLTITNIPKAGSALPAQVETYTYAVPVASLPNFEEIQSARDASGNVSTYSYDASTGLLTSVVQPTVAKPGVGPSAPQLSYTYNTIGLQQTQTDAEGRVTRYEYDATFGDELTKTTTDYGRLNLTSQFTYDSYGDVATVTDGNGHLTTRIYDELRRVLEEDKAVAGVTTKYTYYPDGQINTVSRQVAAGTWETTTHTYTPTGKLHVVTGPMGNTVTTTYDADDRKQTVTTQVSATQNQQQSYSYDALSRLYQVSDTAAGPPGTLLETHTYSPNGNELSFTDANGHTTAYVYDGLDRLSQTTYPDKSTEKYQYNAVGKLSQKTARSGQTIAFTYDALNRVSSKTAAGETGGTVTYGYDLTGILMQAADQSNVTPYVIGHDTAGRATSFTDQQGRTVQAQYDRVGNRTRLQWPANTNGSSAYFATYTYDALNRMTEIDANGSPAAPLAKYQWDALSRTTLITYGDGTSDAYSQYDAGDNLLSLTENFTGGSSVTFSYSWLKNHQRQSTGVNNSVFQYAPVAGTSTYGAADVDNGYTAVSGANLTYDGNHNVTYDGLNTLTFDVENRLIQAQNAISGLAQYSYDPLGHRRQKVVGGVTTQFVLVDEDEIADYSGTGVGAPQLLTVRGPGGLPVATITVASGAVAYYHHDVAGSTVAATQAGTTGPAEVYTYSEFGSPAGGSWAIYRFAGYRYDPETGLYYVHARYYSPQLGRFLQVDPMGFSGGRNLYAYGRNDPINRSDRWGTCDNPAGCPNNQPQIGMVITVGICWWGCVGVTWNTAGSWYVDIGVGFKAGPTGSVVFTNDVEGYSGGWALGASLFGGAGGTSFGSDPAFAVGIGTPGVSLTYGVPWREAVQYLMGGYSDFLTWLVQQPIAFDNSTDVLLTYQ